MNRGISNLAQLLKQLHFEDASDDTRLVFSGVTHEIASSIEETLDSVGYEYDRRTIRGSQLTISLAVTSWRVECPLYSNWASLYATVCRASVIPEKYMVISDLNLSTSQEHDNILRMKILCCARAILSELADHCEPKQGIAKGSDRLLFLIESESSSPSKRYDFKPYLPWVELVKLTQLNESLLALDKLDSALKLEDSQAKERKSVMRSAFSELVSKSSSSDSIFALLITSLPQFQKKYAEHHEMFIQRFSVNKILHEINKQDLEYTSKINEITSSGQTKALTIPAALVVVGSVMKIENAGDAVAVAVGLFLTTIIILKSLIVHQKTFSHLRERIEDEFGRYDNLAEGAEVRLRAIKTKGDLSELVNAASTNLTFVKKTVLVTLVAGLIYISCSAINVYITSTQPLQQSQSQT